MRTIKRVASMCHKDGCWHSPCMPNWYFNQSQKNHRLNSVSYAIQKEQ